MRVVGVDGFARGWVAVALAGGRFERARVLESFDGVMGAFGGSGQACIGVDMPIGLLERGVREADEAARALLGRARASVFVVPPRAAVEAGSWERASELSRRLMGKGISKQLYNLFAKIRQVDAHAGDGRLREVHPEVAFRLLAEQVDGEPSIAWSKKTWAGQALRRRLLDAAGIRLPEDLGEASRVPPDDVLDAAVVAWSATRIATGHARSFPATPIQHDHDRPIAIYA